MISLISKILGWRVKWGRDPKKVYGAPHHCIAILILSIVILGLSSSSAFARQSCYGEINFRSPVFGYKQLPNYQCVNYGGGGEQAALYVYDSHGEHPILPGCYVVQLTDNGWFFSNSIVFCNATVPVTVGAPGTTLFYHPYWGSYCSTTFVWWYGKYGNPVNGTGLEWQPIKRHCAWINGW